MRFYNRGDYYAVQFAKREVADFALRWPRFGAVRALWAQFDKATGDLVDLRGDDGMDAAGVLVLLEDARDLPSNPYREGAAC